MRRQVETVSNACTLRVTKTARMSCCCFSFLLPGVCFKFNIKYGSLCNRNYTNKGTEMHSTATQVEEECSQENEVSLNYVFASSMLNITIGSLAFSRLSSDFSKDF
jgi:hypothetical protein